MCARVCVVFFIGPAYLHIFTHYCNLCHNKLLKGQKHQRRCDEALSFVQMYCQNVISSLEAATKRIKVANLQVSEEGRRGGGVRELEKWEHLGTQ